MILFSNDYYILSNNVGESPLFYYGDAELWEADSEIDSDSDSDMDFEWDIEIIIDNWWELEEDLNYNITEI